MAGRDAASSGRISDPSGAGRGSSLAPSSSGNDRDITASSATAVGATASSGTAAHSCVVARSLPCSTTEWTLLEFARHLHREVPLHFATEEAVLELLRPAEKFSSLGVDISRPCTHRHRGRCWMHHYQNAWNEFLSTHGQELLESPTGLIVRTLRVPGRVNVDPECTLLSMCIVLWLLYQHRCITSATLSADVIVPHHVSTFYRLLRFHEGYVSVHADDAEPAGAWNCHLFDALHRTSHLQVFHVSALRLGELECDGLCALLGRNPHLSVLVFRRVTVDSTAAANFFKGLTVLKALEQLEFEATAGEQSECDVIITKLLQTTVRWLNLTIACNMTEFFEQLAHNHMLQELELGHPVSQMESFVSLATSLAVNRSLRCLKVAVNMNHSTGYEDFCDALSKLVRNNRRLEVLDLSGSTLHGGQAAKALSDSLRHNYTLDRLYLHHCDLTCTDVLLILDGLKENVSLRELCFGLVSDTPSVRASVFESIVRHGLVDRVTFVWRDDEISLLAEHLESSLSPRKLYFSAEDAWPEDVCNFLKVLPEFHSTLDTLYIHAPGVITTDGARSLSSLFELSTALHKVAVIYETTQESSLTLLEGLASSNCIAFFAFGGWNLGGMVSVAFRTALMNNMSLLQLNVHWSDGERVPSEFENMFPDAVCTSKSLVTVRHFRDREEVKEDMTDVIVRSTLRTNEMALRDALDVILQKKLTAQASYAYHRLRFCDDQGSCFPNVGCTSRQTNSLLELYHSIRHSLRRLRLQYDSVSEPNPERNLRAEFEELYLHCLSQVKKRVCASTTL
ncbi:uncharacterized protein [Dermacentor andersoni]|uniref:uncharacterized protein n=1 Tax=Dermacentor andersoni TaxID=34620 RepID=UPI0021553DD0|nr:uncharacterized protein LOC126518614 [Dermacentor andersoni]